MLSRSAVHGDAAADPPRAEPVHPHLRDDHHVRGHLQVRSTVHCPQINS